MHSSNGVRQSDDNSTVGSKTCGRVVIFERALHLLRQGNLGKAEVTVCLRHNLLSNGWKRQETKIGAKI